MSEFSDGLNLGLSFVVRNTAPGGKKLTLFNTPLGNGNTLDLMKIPGVSEDDIKASVLKGELGQKLRIRYLTLVTNTLDFGDNSDPTYTGLLTSIGITTSPRKNNQTTWYVSPATGNDINSGLVGSPLKTLTELGRRLSSNLVRSLITVNLLDNIVDAADNLQFFATHQSEGTLPPDGGNTFGLLNVALLIQGQRTNASFTDPNTSSTTQLTMTSVALAPATTTGTAGPSGTSGLPAILTVTGFDFTPYIGMLVRITSATPAASQNNIAVIVAAPSSGVAHISPLVLPSAAGASVAPLTAANYPLNGSTFVIYTTTSWAPSFVVGGFSYGNSAIMYQDVTFPVATRQVAHGQHYFFNGCVFNRVIGFSNGGEAAPLIQYTGCSYNLAAPPGGRTPTQMTFTSGDNRFQSCGFVNIDLRCREGDGRLALQNCVMYNSQVVSGGPNDLNRSGPVFSLILGGAVIGDFGLGMFNWFSPDTLAPSPATVRGSAGAGVHIGHGAKVSINAKLYGYSSNSGTYGVKVQEGAHLYITDRLSAQVAPANLGGANPPYLAASLRITGLVSDFLIDGYLSPLTDSFAGTLIPFSTLRGILNGTVSLSTANDVPCTTWITWETGAFLRNAVSLRTGAGIISILS
jgi:hypothetical protein